MPTSYILLALNMIKHSPALFCFPMMIAKVESYPLLNLAYLVLPCLTSVLTPTNPSFCHSFFSVCSVCMCVGPWYMWRTVIGIRCLPQLISTFIMGHKVFHWIWSLCIRLDRPASTSQAYCWLCLPRAGITCASIPSWWGFCAQVLLFAR